MSRQRKVHFVPFSEYHFCEVLTLIRLEDTTRFVSVVEFRPVGFRQIPRSGPATRSTRETAICADELAINPCHHVLVVGRGVLMPSVCDDLYRIRAHEVRLVLIARVLVDTRRQLWASSRTLPARYPRTT